MTAREPLVLGPLGMEGAPTQRQEGGTQVAMGAPPLSAGVDSALQQYVHEALMTGRPLKRGKQQLSAPTQPHPPARPQPVEVMPRWGQRENASGACPAEPARPMFVMPPAEPARPIPPWRQRADAMPVAMRQLLSPK